MATWTDEQKQGIIDAYQAAEPTAANSMEIVNQITKDGGYPSPNGVRMILSQAGVYIKKEGAAAKPAASGGKAATGDKAPRVSKEAAQTRLTDAITAAGGEVDTEITSKLTGKAALYLADVIERATAGTEVED